MVLPLIRHLALSVLLISIRIGSTLMNCNRIISHTEATSLSKSQIRIEQYPNRFGDLSSFEFRCRNTLCTKSNDNDDINKKLENKSAFEKVASAGLAGVLAIAVAEAIFWALGVPLAEAWYKLTTGEWIDITTSDGQLKAAGFSFGYGSFATLILQYRVTLFAIPLVPIMERFVVGPLTRALQKKQDIN